MVSIATLSDPSIVITVSVTVRRQSQENTVVVVGWFVDIFRKTCLLVVINNIIIKAKYSTIYD